MSLQPFITDDDDLEQQLSAAEFIKTLKKVDSFDNGKKGKQSSSSSASGSSEQIITTKCDESKKKVIEKKPSASELLVKMRSRFQHRATEPVFHTLINTIDDVEESNTSVSRETEEPLSMPKINALKCPRRTDSAPDNMNRNPYKKYMKESSSNNDLS